MKDFGYAVQRLQCPQCGEWVDGDEAEIDPVEEIVLAHEECGYCTHHDDMRAGEGEKKQCWTCGHILDGSREVWRSITLTVDVSWRAVARIVAEGRTVDQALAEIREALLEMLLDEHERGHEINLGLDDRVDVFWPESPWGVDIRRSS
ncbi:MAG: hypothetical protein GF320_05860 [Armatimonadia bacterium]|nr:hypothetical protein [Armatimonadia bacterium]